MAKTNEAPRPAPRVQRANEYKMNRRDMSSPYMASYMASRAERPRPSNVKMRPIYVGAKQNDVYDDYEDYYQEPEVNVKNKRTKGKAKRARRGFIVFLIALFTLLYIAVAALSYLNMDALSDYNKYFALYEVPGAAEDDTVAKEETAEAASAADTETDAETDTEDTETDVPAEAAYIGLEDVVMSFVACFIDSVDGEGYYFYDNYYADIDSADTVTMIACYAMPVTLALGLVIALIFFIRALVALFGSKRRKLFIFSAVLMLIMTVLFAACGFLIFAGTDFSVLMSFLSMDGSLGLQLGIGTIIMAGLSLVTFVFSLFAFRPKKKLS